MTPTDLQPLIDNFFQHKQQHASEELAEDKGFSTHDIEMYLLDYEGLDKLPEAEQDDICEMVKHVIESEWYRDRYQEAMDRAREGIREQEAWQETKDSYTPKMHISGIIGI